VDKTGLLCIQLNHLQCMGDKAKLATKVAAEVVEEITFDRSTCSSSDNSLNEAS